MACGALSYGFDYECLENPGGIKIGSILIAQWSSITASPVTGGIVTSITQAASTFFYRYQIDKFLASETTNGVADPATGRKSYTSVVTFPLFNMSASKNTELETLMSKPLVVIYQDNNDVWHCVGLRYGARALTIDRQTGAAKGDMNGYTISITAEEKDFPYEVQASVVSGLTISGNLS